ncbi:vanillate O-demethylase ferredoxin subunit [Altererythrobacter atlanticus]|uniref:Phenoxybenzoate dioxygenase subunit beta n=1 Tax=Croceibacterium atlanticum TaxID=1267766 RepID=A0A0F7KVK6_9SPHN|nr:PDR/VanB family oxidoreductase [Croceibacterium atlanticum]AKH44358.1 Phenoxybenzoate dioxygenase subunit beta [Croceibacterium atlanticum]MBB5733925.1 vanillate O-demethylase ferredoxin subunit [Croceibacterium atlanticum]
MKARIKKIEWEADGINSYFLTSLDGQDMPAFEPGAHVDVELKPGLTRSYSLVNDPKQRGYYEIAVHHAIDSRGGSRHIHEVWRVGEVVEISAPRNNFPMNEDAAHTVLIAGGIGVTPMLPMIARLEELGKSWELHYVAATPERAAYVDRLSAYPSARIVYDGIEGGARLDLAALSEGAPADAHLYCCGPGGMLDAFVALNKGRPADKVHIEYFSAETEIATDGGYSLELTRSGKTIQVAEGETMLDALLSAGVDIGFACSEGVCGTCQVKVLDGVPDHRDHFLTDAEKAANSSVMVCCSGSNSAKLVLDI